MTRLYDAYNNNDIDRQTLLAYLNAGFKINDEIFLEENHNVQLITDTYLDLYINHTWIIDTNHVVVGSLGTDGDMVIAGNLINNGELTLNYGTGQITITGTFTNTGTFTFAPSS